MSGTNLSQQRLVEVFNENNALGTRVRYWPRTRRGACLETLTRSEAFLLGGHTACVWLVGVPECVALRHVEVIREDRGAEPRYQPSGQRD